MKFSIPQKLLFLSLIILAGNLVLGYKVYRSNQKLVTSGSWVQHTEQVIAQSVKIYSTVKDIETSSRGFVITKDSSYMSPFNASGKTALTYIDQLRQLTRDNPAQQIRVDVLDFYVNKLLEFSKKAVSLRSNEKLADAVSYISGQQGKYYTDRIRQTTNEIQQAELVLLKQRKQVDDSNTVVYHRYSITIFILMAIFTVLLLMATGNYLFHNKEKRKREAELVIANKELLFQNEEKEKRAAELIIANEELLFQNNEKEKRAAELVTANKELSYQNDEKGKRAAELLIANKELVVASEEKGRRADELLSLNEMLSFRNQERERRAAELVIANKELSFQNSEKEKRAAELVIANKELSYQNQEKEKRAAELVMANVELFYQNKEKESRAAELAIANKELVYQNEEKESRAAELAIANKELIYQNEEKENRAAELIIANKELSFQNEEKERRAAELINANMELFYQNKDKEERAAELAITNRELVFQIDERKSAEKNLVQSESKLKEAQTIARLGNFEVDMKTKIIGWSDEMYKIYGIQREIAPPSRALFLSLVYPDDRSFVAKTVINAYKDFKNYTIDFRFMHANGDIRYGYLEAQFEFGKGKAPVRLFGILQDVTEGKLAEIERIRMLNDLVIRNKDLEQFAYIISHNLRAPIANIIGASNALEDEDLTIDDKETLNSGISKSISKLDDVVQDLNHILEVKGGVNEHKQMVSFAELVDEIKSNIKHECEITYDFSRVDKIFSLKPYLYSIFYNLISNSVKYRRQNVTCAIEIKSSKIKNGIKLTFTDNSLGIDLEKYGEQVFGLYRRFHPAIEGKGMGLYMVKTQVETLGGKINIKSKENEGTEFVIEFEA